jgi:HD superfamily phosphohydrolase
VAIHDPIHGSIEVTPGELKVIDSRPFQRLRSIKQLGFSEMAFPGATHSRYAHGLGAMHMASRIYDRLAPTIPLDLGDKAQPLRQAVRLACLLHDLGHPPLSHVSERVMPPVRLLGLDAAGVGDGGDRQASHEDYTLLLLLKSELTAILTEQFQAVGVAPQDVAALISGRHLPYGGSGGASTQSLFVVGGYDLLPLLHSVVSSELDADRMDYLRRDAYYCGVSYGNYDHVWLCNNLTCVEHDGQLSLGILHKAVWGFENFILARYHMFLAVYYHHSTVCFDHLLGAWYQESQYQLPHEVQAYLDTDDVALWWALRQSGSPWAKQVVQRKAWRMVVETHDFGQGYDDSRLKGQLEGRAIPYFTTHSEGLLSRYFHEAEGLSNLLVLEPERSRVRTISAYTPLYERFRDRANIFRIYCPPDRIEEARRSLPIGS